MTSDLAHAFDAHPPTAQRRCAPQVLRRSPHALEDAVRRQDRRVARSAMGGRTPGDEARLARDDVHVFDIRPDIACRVITAADCLHEAAISPQQRLGLVALRIAPDHRLATAVVQAGERVLVRHATGQFAHVVYRVLLGRTSRTSWHGTMQMWGSLWHTSCSRWCERERVRRLPARLRTARRVPGRLRAPAPRAARRRPVAGPPSRDGGGAPCRAARRCLRAAGRRQRARHRRDRDD